MDDLGVPPFWELAHWNFKSNFGVRSCRLDRTPRLTIAPFSKFAAWTCFRCFMEQWFILTLNHPYITQIWGFSWFSTNGGTPSSLDGFWENPIENSWMRTFGVAMGDSGNHHFGKRGKLEVSTMDKKDKKWPKISLTVPPYRSTATNKTGCSAIIFSQSSLGCQLQVQQSGEDGQTSRQGTTRDTCPRS